MTVVWGVTLPSTSLEEELFLLIAAFVQEQELFQTSFVQRNLRQCPMECRKSAYIALVRATLEYGSVVQRYIDTVEKVQRRAARFIKNDFRSRHKGAVTQNILDRPH